MSSIIVSIDNMLFLSVFLLILSSFFLNLGIKSSGWYKLFISFAGIIFDVGIVLLFNMLKVYIADNKDYGYILYTMTFILLLTGILALFIGVSEMITDIFKNKNQGVKK